MRSPWIAVALLFGINGTAAAQAVSAGSAYLATASPPAAPVAFRADVSTPSSVRGDLAAPGSLRGDIAAPRPQVTPSPTSSIFDDSDRQDDPAVAAARLLRRLPLERVQKTLLGNRSVRLAGATIGATLVGLELRQDRSSALAQVAVQALRFGGADWLEHGRFRVEPAVVSGGFAVFVHGR